MKNWVVLLLIVGMFCGVGLLLFTTKGQAGDSGRGSMDVSLNRQPLSLPLIDPKIVIVKSKRLLNLYSDNRVVRRFRVSIGYNPIGEKLKEGDGRTPEGTYYICLKNPNSQYHLSLGISYPNQQDADRGLATGLIIQEQYNRIGRMILDGDIPPWKTELGGEVFIHGSRVDNGSTQGCIAVSNTEIEELYSVVPLRTLVLIQP